MIEHARGPQCAAKVQARTSPQCLRKSQWQIRGVEHTPVSLCWQHARMLERQHYLVLARGTIPTWLNWDGTRYYLTYQASF
jgi:hypothetical protein